MIDSEIPELPAGLEFERELAPTSPFRRFEILDDRSAARLPCIGCCSKDFGCFVESDVARRTAPLGGGAIWPQEIIKTADGGVLFLSPQYPEDARLSDVLANKLSALLLPPAWLLAENLLMALAVLHHQKAPHGGLCPERILLHYSDGQFCGVSLLDHKLAALAFWGEGNWVDKVASSYRDKDWNTRKETAPSDADDLFALGKILEQHPQKKQLARLIQKLTEADPKERGSASGRLKELRSSGTAWGYFTAIALVLAITLFAAVAIGLSIHQQSNQITALNKQVEKLHSDSQSLKDKKSELENEKSELQKQVSQLEERIKGLESPSDQSPEAHAKQIWKEVFKAPLRSKNDLKSAIEEMTNKIKRSDEVQKLLKKWLEYARGLHAGRTGTWFDHDTVKDGYRDLAIKALGEPWNGASVEAAKDRVDALEEALKLWKIWAYDETLTPADIERKLGAMSDKDQQKAILSGWWQAYPTAQRAFTVQPKVASVKENWGLDFTIYVQQGSVSRKWTTWQSHVYVDPANSFIFRWKAGDSITVLFNGPVQYTGQYRVVYQSFKGPLALWRLNDTGTMSSGYGSLTLEIPDCPEPPPTSSFPTTAANLPSPAKP